MKATRDRAVDNHRDLVIELVFKKNYKTGASEASFTKEDIVEAVAAVQKKHPAYYERNIPDIRYQYTAGRRPFPASIDQLGPWMIDGRGKGKYAFVKLAGATEVTITADLLTIALPDATPEIVLAYAGNDEQGVLAKIHYNRLLDIFLQITCYHLQNHWRTSLAGKGQCEIDDLYVGLNANGKQFVIPVESKSARDRLNKTQIVQAIGFAKHRFPKLIVRPVGVQEMSDGSLMLIEFTPAIQPDEVKVKEMRRYKLCPMKDVPLEAQQAAP